MVATDVIGTRFPASTRSLRLPGAHAAREDDGYIQATTLVGDHAAKLVNLAYCCCTRGVLLSHPPRTEATAGGEDEDVEVELLEIGEELEMTTMLEGRTFLFSTSSHDYA